MRYIILNNGEELNRIVADEPFVKEHCAQNNYSYEALPEPEPTGNPDLVEAEPSPQDDTDAMLIDHEYRLTLLELGLTE